MGGRILPWARRVSPAGGWTNDELAELYRVEHSLVQAGVVVETESGLSDEGDPWFVFCHPDGHVVVHTARIDGLYHLYCATLPAPLTGQNFAEIAKTFVTMIAKVQNTGLSGRVVAHPSALLSLLVAAAVLSVDAVLHNSAQASELSPPPRNHLFAQDPAPAAPKTTIVKEVADIFFSAVWRDSEGSGEREAVWRAVEGAAVGLCALSGALPFDRPLMELSRTELTLGVQPLPEGAETPDKFPGRPMLADTVNASSLPVEAGAFTERGIVTDAALFNLTPRPFQPAIDAPTYLTFGGVISPEESMTYATPSGARWSAEGNGASSSPQVNSLISSPTLSLNSVDGACLHINLTSGGETIDLDRFATGSVSISISGGGALNLTHAGAVHSIEVASGVKAGLTLSYDVTRSTAPIDQTTDPTAPIDLTLKLDGATRVSVMMESTASASTPPVTLVVESEGAQTNTLNLTDGTQGPPTDLSLKLIGTQDLVLNEPAASALSSTLDASSLSGQLMLGIKLGDVAATNLSIGSANFIVTPEASIAIENLSAQQSVDLGIDLNSVLFQYKNSATTGGPVALSINMGSLGTKAAPVTIGSISTDVNDLSVNSSSSNNDIGAINDHTLANLTLSGSTPLEIDSIQGITANDPQNVVIDAETLAGTLTLNASAIADTLAGGRQVEIATGSGASIITDTNLSELLSLTIGSGNAIVNIASGAAHVTISGLKGTDQVNVGSGGIVDLFTNGLNKILPHQSAIDASANLMEAAAMAASLAESGAAHQALLFSYRGSTYVFVDAFGNHIFDPSADAIVHVVGVTSPTELSSVFHSA